MTGTTVSATQVAQMRALADRRRSRSAFQELHQGGVVDTLDWLAPKQAPAGVRTWSPSKGPGTRMPRVADDDGIRDELTEVRDEEARAPLGDRKARLHAVAVTIGWFLCDPNCPNPS